MTELPKADMTGAFGSRPKNNAGGALSFVSKNST